ncbi:MAG: CHAT domain-containing protein [Cyclobacteriaceae bacterium]|jgi:CHAT domain-containing protein
MKKIGVALLCLLLSLQALAQAKYDKMIAGAEAAYRSGDYKKAISALAKFQKKAAAKLGKTNKYTPAYHMMLAKYSLASGMVSDFQTNMEEALRTSVSINGESSVAHYLVMVEAGELNNLNGSYLNARTLLDKAKKTGEASGQLTEAQKARWDLAFAETLTGQGYYTQAVDLLSEKEKFYAGRAVKQETYVDNNGGLKTRKLSDEEVKARYEEYARYLTLMTEALGKRGSQTAADSVYVFAEPWTKSKLGKFNIYNIALRLKMAKILTGHGTALPKELDPADILNDLRAEYKASHYVGVELYEVYLAQLLKDGNQSKYLNVKLEYEKMMKSAFPDESIYNIRVKAVEFDSKMSRDKTKNLENEAVKLLNANSALPKNNALTADVYEFLYDLSVYDKKYAKAEEYRNQITEIKTSLLGADAPETHLAKLKLANFYLDFTNKLAEAGKIYEDSYVKRVAPEIGAWQKDHLAILNHLATYYELTDRYREANETLEKAKYVANAKYSNKDHEFAIEMTNIAKLQIKMGQYEKAEENLNAAIPILREVSKEKEFVKGPLANAIETNATLLGLKGLFEEAEDELDRSSRIIAKADVKLDIDELTTAKELSSLFIQLGRYSITEELVDKLLLEWEKLYGGNSVRLIDPLVDKGRLKLAQGDYTQAEKIAQRASQIANSVYGEKSTKSAPAQKLLADIDYAIGDYDNAEELLTKAIASQEKQFGRKHIEVAKSLSQLALCKFYKGDSRAEVEKIMTEAQQIVGERLGTKTPLYADLLKNLAVLYIAERKFDKAFSALTQAQGIWREKTGRRSINEASIFVLTGDVYYQLKNYKQAESFYTQGKDIYEKNFSRTHPEYVKVLSKMARVYFMQKDYKTSKRNIEEALNNYEGFIKQYFPALSEREKAKYWNTIKVDFEFYNTLAFSQLDDFRDLVGKVYNYQLLTKALLLNSSIKIRERILNSKDENLKAAYNLWVEKKEFLTNALAMSQQQLVDNGIDLNALTTEVERLERDLSEKSELFGQSFENKKVTYENVQKSLGKNEVAVEMLRFRYFDHTFTDSVIYVALYVKADNARPKVIELPEGHRMETRYFRFFRNAIYNKLPDNVSYNVFWEPIQKEIGQYSTIYLSPDGVYNQLNLEAIRTPDGKYVIDNSNIVMVNNTKDLYFRKVKGKAGMPGKTATMFGNPTFYLTASASNSVSQLPGTEKEVQELDELLKQKGWTTNEFMEKEATEEQVKMLVNPKIFHIATHGFYTPALTSDEMAKLTANEAMMTENPLLKSGLLLKGAGDILDQTKFNYNMDNGILTAYEAMNLNLDQTDLVVLSACETGLGEISNGEGVYGLQRAFLVAGAKVLIMSMFKVDDEATQKLILNFYQKWLASGNMRLSFVEAKKELRVEYPEPIYWGAFMMIGLD